MINTISMEQRKCHELRKLKKDPTTTKYLILKQVGYYEVNFYKIQRGMTDQNNTTMYVTTSLRKPIIKWYYSKLLHPWTTRMTKTMMMWYEWPNMVTDINKSNRTCNCCQKFKLTAHKQYVSIPLPTKTSPEPWNEVHLYLVGPLSEKFYNTRNEPLRQI